MLKQLMNYQDFTIFWSAIDVLSLLFGICSFICWWAFAWGLFGRKLLCLRFGCLLFGSNCVRKKIGWHMKKKVDFRNFCTWKIFGKFKFKFNKSLYKSKYHWEKVQILAFKYSKYKFKHKYTYSWYDKHKYDNFWIFAV